jgi:uncharacterized protein (DUF2267 family)
MSCSANDWLDELMDEMDWRDRHCAYHAMRSVLHALRDRMGSNQAVALGALLPIGVRGLYYEDWHPSRNAWVSTVKDEFLAQVRDALHFDPDIDAERTARSVFRVLAKHLSEGELEDVRNALPAELRSLWPQGRQ